MSFVLLLSVSQRKETGCAESPRVCRELEELNAFVIIPGTHRASAIKPQRRSDSVLYQREQKSCAKYEQQTTAVNANLLIGTRRDCNGWPAKIPKTAVEVGEKVVEEIHCGTYDEQQSLAWGQWTVHRAVGEKSSTSKGMKGWVWWTQFFFCGLR